MVLMNIRTSNISALEICEDDAFKQKIHVFTVTEEKEINR